MDIVLKTENGRFNFRVCGLIINDGKVLAMHDEKSPYYYLPGGRVNLHETVEDAILRELKEELGISAEIVRPLWINQAFFVEDLSKDRFHEICFYFLIDALKTDLFERGENFTRTEGKHTLRFEWLKFEELKEKYLYPEFIKDEIFNLPDKIVINVEDRKIRRGT